MRAVFGVVVLLVALAIVGMLAVKQLKATGQSVGAALPAAGGSATEATAANVREQSQQLQQRVQSDIAKALEQGGAARASEPEQ